MNLGQAEKVLLLLPPDLADLRETLAARIARHKDAIATAAQALANFPAELSFEQIRFEFSLHKDNWSQTWRNKVREIGGRYSDCRGTSYRFLALPILGNAIWIAEKLIDLELVRIKSVTITVSSRSFAVKLGSCTHFTDKKSRSFAVKHRDDVVQVYDHAKAVAQERHDWEKDQLQKTLEKAQQYPIYL